MIIVDAEEPEEDQSLWSCTLFKLILDEAKKEFLLWHVQTGRYGVPYQLPSGDFIILGSSEVQDDKIYYTMVNLETLFVLPKRVALKGNNGKYLSPDSSRNELLRYSAENVSDPKALNVVNLTADGSININVASTNKYWKREKGGSEWVLANADEDSLDADSSFWPVKIEKDIVALRNLGNNLFCKRFTGRGIQNGLSARAPNTSDVHTNKWVEEPVTVREIFDINYQHVDTKIYDTKTQILVSISFNNTSQKPQDTEFRYTYVNDTISAWNSTVWPKLFSTVHLRADVPTNVATLKEALPSFEDENYEWGKTKTITTSSALTYDATIPPKTDVTVKLVATWAKFDIPFFYTQLDTLATGEKVTYKLEDGIFSGSGSFGFKFETEEKPIP